MPIQYKFFLIPIKSFEETETELNRFLKSVRVLTIHKEFVGNEENSFWSLAVEYLSSDIESKENKNTQKKRVDYKEILSPEEFAAFAKLRDWRKKVAGEEAVPVYAIFTNDQLAEIVTNKVSSLTELQKIKGIGDSRSKKYGKNIIEILQNNFPVKKVVSE
ncbi:MAG: hypothetical protein GY850_19495 [bacterium]|nr:hypothetical protein [bacterium]